MLIESPLCLYHGMVLPEWIDYNDHMNIAYYVLTFDHATDALIDYLGMGQDYRERSQCSTFVLESHIVFQRELKANDRIRVTTQLLGFDSKRIHYFHRMYHDDKGFLAATTELIAMHVDLIQRRGKSMPLDVSDRLNAIMSEHMQLPYPPQSGRVIRIRPLPNAIR